MRLKLSDILEAREKLEAIGLLKTYCKKGSINNYVYELYSPISVDEFINNPILNTTLYNNIGEGEYQKIIAYFSVPKIDLKEYEDISRAFKDTFEVSNFSNIDSINDNIKKANSLDLVITPKIDLNNIFALIPDEIINYNRVPKKTEELIYKLAFIYDLNDDDMSNIIRNSLNEKHTIDKNLLRNNCQNFYKLEHSGKLPSIIYRNQPEYLRKPVCDTSKKSKMIYMFETTSPYDFLTSKNRGVKPNNNDLKTAELLLIDYEFNPGVVNVLIDYVLRINNNKLIKNFVEAIASQWQKSKITTVEQAMSLAEKEHQNKKTSYTKSYKKAKKLPTWYGENIESDEMTEEELKAFKEKLNSIE